MTTRLSLLGPLELTAADGRSIQSVLAQPRRLALLAYLAAASPRGFHSRDRLVVLFWPEADESSARNSLRQALHYLRRSLGDAVFRSRGEELGIDPDHLACDVALFDGAVKAGQLEQALRLYRGDLLEAFHIADAPDFDRWVAEQRIRLRRRAVDAAWALVDDAEARGDGTAMLTCARRAHALAPDEEVSLRRLLALLDRSGERADALREYHAFAHRLAADYELEPSPETCALISGIRSRVAAQDAPGPANVAGSMPTSEAGQRMTLSPLLHNDTADFAGTTAEPGRGAAEPEIENGATQVIAMRPVRRPRVWAWAAGIMLLIAATFTAASVHDRSPLQQGRVLVASFENRAGDPALDPLGDMAADWIAQGLQQTGLVEVIDPASSLLMSREAIVDGRMAEPLRTAALAGVSGAGTVISGAFYQQGDSIVFRTRITDAKTGVTLHALEPVSAPFAEPIGSVEVLRSRVAGVLATMLDSRMSSLSPPASRPPTYEAYREYINGLELFVSQRSTESIPHFAAAARLDTMFALPLVWSVFAYGNNGYRAERDSVVRILEARRHRLDPLDLHALDYFAARYSGDKAAALASARKAAQIAPGSQWSHNAAYMARDRNRLNEALSHWEQIDPERGWAKSWKSYWDGVTGAHHVLGQHEKELKAAERGRRLAPDMLPHRFFIVRALVALGRIEEATEHVQEALLSSERNFMSGEMHSATAREMRAHGHPEAAAYQLQLAIDWFRSPAAEEWIRGHDRPEIGRRHLLGLLGMTLYEAGRYDEAYVHLEAISREYPGQFDHFLGLVAARRANRQEAERVIELLESRKDDALTAGEVAIHQARITTLLGDRTRTLGYLREAIRRGYSVDLLHTMPEFDPLRGDAAFRALIRVRG